MVALQDTVAAPEPVTLLGAIAAQVRPEGIVSVRFTIPAKRFNEAIVIVDVADTPTLTVGGDVAVIVKSRNWKRAVALRTRGVLVPVTLSV